MSLRGHAAQAALLALLASSMTGCARRDTAYHFRAPLVSSVHADSLPGRTANTSPDPSRDSVAGA